MNYLAHIALSGDNPEHRVGGFLGDFIRGPLQGVFPDAIEAGIAAHRKLDAHVDQQPELIDFLSRFKAPLRRYAGIVADLVYDHILASQWSTYYQQPFEEFCQQFYRQLGSHHQLLPPGAQRFLHVAPQVGWLESYRDESNLPLIRERVGSRFKKPVALQDALPVFAEHKEGIEQEFHRLYPRLQQFVNELLPHSTP